MRIGLYFGSFNPIHIGHLIIAQHVLQHTALERIWFVVSPHNPLKESSSLLNEYHRLHLVELAIVDNPQFKASNIEFHLPRPSYTVDTMAYLREKFPNEQFSIIMGSDSIQNIHRWKNYQQLLEQHMLMVYVRPGHQVPQDLPTTTRIEVLHAPMLDISSTFIRQLIKAGKSAQYLLPDVVWKELQENNYYR